MDTLGTHLLVEYEGCDPELLNDETRIRALMRQAATAAGATEVAVVFHRFSPQGITGVVVVEESHLSIHTWPEHGYASVDFYTCGECHPERAQEVLRRGLGAKRCEVMRIDRGIPKAARAMRMVKHTQTGEARVAEDHSPLAS